MKIEITKKKAEQFNRMLNAHKKISKAYQTPKQLRKDSKKDWGLDYEEALEMAYENIQQEAAVAANGVSEIKMPVAEATLAALESRKEVQL